jgi:hypothetical protein
MQQLDRDEAVQQRVFGAPDRRHTASGDLAHESVPAAEDAFGR